MDNPDWNLLKYGTKKSRWLKRQQNTLKETQVNLLINLGRSARYCLRQLLRKNQQIQIINSLIQVALRAG